MSAENKLSPAIARVTTRIQERSQDSRDEYLSRLAEAEKRGPRRPHLLCRNLAHVSAASPQNDKQRIVGENTRGNLGIVTAYNDMLSAHQPFETYPETIRETARAAGGTAQVAGGVPAMCDGVTQSQPGMELSLFSRDVIALAAGVGLAHDCFDAAAFLGVCDKIVPGLVIAAATFGHLPAVFIPAGPMTTGIGNAEHAQVRVRFARGEVGREELLRAEMAAYHGAGTCTFYGTANSNQMLMEFMGLHMPGASFINPETPLRGALTRAAVRRVLELTLRSGSYLPAGRVLDARAFVNGIVGLNATGGSTNLVMHLTAMARAAGVILTAEDFADISAAVPLLCKVYPNGVADVNQFHAAGGLGFVIGELLDAGLLHPDTETLAGRGLALYRREPKVGADGELRYEDGAAASLDENIVRPVSRAFSAQGGLRYLRGDLGDAVIKVSSVKPEYRVIEGPARVFLSQEAVQAAFERGELNRDCVIVVSFQGPHANGMPELHGLTPSLNLLQQRGHRVALVTDGRMSGASGVIPAAIHVSPEAARGGLIARLRDGDILRLDAEGGRLDVLAPSDWRARAPVQADLSGHEFGVGREMFRSFREHVGSASDGAAVVV
ncbi:MAG: phosphogluconate dehydratase [Alphaproteobacteria bacterium]|nr:phosphogluconate dehydratase [Alphaproteobacteria bacterium]MDA7983867.1 phosphogluconate dehydratase [Alphaproteobacteria bacterium]MDA8010327.1 phosphogluconate dehydratase [Alphaproteobacteria bacterium]